MTIRCSVSERRQSLRFDKMFVVLLQSADGILRGTGRNISSRGLYVEVQEALALGQKVKVTFSGEDGTEMTCLCEVRYQMALNYGETGSRGVGLKIIAYEVGEQQPLLLVDKAHILH
ncbi:MAG: PilZ domain-containing protein [Cystobacterineae bacterium]|nr:PilZ domain-containing protein [Cystobacterineae bacterium]